MSAACVLAKNHHTVSTHPCNISSLHISIQCCHIWY